MTREQFAALLGEIQEKERAVRADGQKEYAHDADNCFANFDSDADHGVSRLQSIATHLNKHMRGIKAFVNGHHSQREDIRGRIKDARLYLALLWGAIEDEERAADRGLQNFIESGERTVLPSGAQLTLVEAGDDGWVYGADPLDELSRQPNMNPPAFRAGYRELPGPRYTDIVEAPKHALAEAMAVASRVGLSIK